MRIRRKKWAEKELFESPIYIKRKTDTKGKWKDIFKNTDDDTKMYIEIGCGKGLFFATVAHDNMDKNVNYVAVDMIEAMLGLAKRNIENVYNDISNEDRQKLDTFSEKVIRICKSKINELENESESESNNKIESSNVSNPDIKEGEKYLDLDVEKQADGTYLIIDNKAECKQKNKINEKHFSKIYNGLELKIPTSILDKELLEIALKLNKKEEKDYPNIRLLDTDAEKICDYFSKEDKVSRIYLNFSNPWPKDRHKKRRLTHTTKLKKYLEFLQPNGEIFFKTDDYPFFEESREYFKECGFKEVLATHDLKNNDIFKEYDGYNNIKTEHEMAFENEGKKINAAIYIHE